MMLRSSKAIWASLAVACGMLAPATAQEVKVQAGQNEVQVDVDREGRQKSARGILMRASQVQGMTVLDGADKELATVNDIVISANRGKVKYAAISYGGLLGVGDKLFAVPWDAFELRKDASGDEYYLRLNVDRETLKNAPGFDDEKWPNFADPQFEAEMQKHYGKARLRGDDRGAGVDIEAGRGGVDVDVNLDRERRAENRQELTFRAGFIMDMAVKNAGGEELGSVNDLVIDMHQGDVQYAALSFGGVAGLGDKLFAIPWNSLDSKHNAENEEYYFVLNVDDATLKNAPGFDQDNWPSMADPSFRDQIDKHYGRRDRADRNERPKKGIDR